ncbi:MAG TPA: thiamine phosphate synthase [Sphingomicrobium sp.]|nr:thiamine phosphate synthase [Sphingomicrobium sp.]
MTARQTGWPRCWLMTDERMGERLWQAIDRLPIGDGAVVVRHYGLASEQRAALAGQIAAVCGKRGLMLAIAKDAALARSLDAELVHHPDTVPGDGLAFSRPVHALADAEQARREGASLVFVSPIHATRSHPGTKPLSRELARRIVRAAGCPAIALGGMDARNFVRAEKDGFYGWAAIDAWIR